MVPFQPIPNWKCSAKRIMAISLGAIFLLFCLTEFSAEARKRRAASSSLLKILEVTTSPSPFAAGTGMLQFSIVVKMPENLNGANMLEVSSLISFPSKRSVRFISHRMRIPPQQGISGNSRIQATLLWDGKDQTQQLVEPGRYHYEVRAKLMADEGFGPRTRMISRRAQGTVNVTHPALKEEVEEASQVDETNAKTGQEESVSDEQEPEESTGESREEGRQVPEQESNETLDMEEEVLEPTDEVLSPREG